MFSELDGPATFGMSIIVFIVLPFWFIYFVTLLLTKGAARSVISIFGLTVLTSCVSWGISSDLAQEVTPEHVVIANVPHRPRLTFTLLLSVLLIAAAAGAFRIWRMNRPQAKYGAAFIIVPALGAYVAYVWTMAAYYGLAALFRP